MKIFLSYSSKDRALAEQIHLALRAQGHNVFFDRSDLPAGEEYDVRIRQAIEDAGLFLFLVSPDSLSDGAYTLTELAIAQKTWEHPGGRVLPVMLRQTDITRLPPYLRAVTVLEPTGNLPAAVADAVHRIAAGRRLRIRNNVLAGVGVIIAGAASAYLLAPDWFSSLSGQPASEIIGKDGAPALLVAAGKFVMGDDETSPKREVYVDAFYMDKYEISIARYAKFLEATGSRQTPEYWNELDLGSHGDLPVIGVNWHEALAYCRWAGKRLPTEAEWEKAARGNDGRTYPWGENAPTASLANFGKESGNPFAGGLTSITSHEDGKSPYGIFNLAGNVEEWVADWYAEGYRTGAVWNPTGADSGKDKVIRGGAWYGRLDALETARRFYVNPADRSDDRGFRCAQETPK